MILGMNNIAMDSIPLVKEKLIDYIEADGRPV
jgi:hypothetical protein